MDNNPKLFHCWRIVTQGVVPQQYHHKTLLLPLYIKEHQKQNIPCQRLKWKFTTVGCKNDCWTEITNGKTGWNKNEATRLMCTSFAPSSNPANIKKTFFKIGFPSDPYSHHYTSSEEDLMTVNISTICQKEYNICFVIFNQNSGFQTHSTLTRVDFELKSVGPAPWYELDRMFHAGFVAINGRYKLNNHHKIANC